MLAPLASGGPLTHVDTDIFALRYFGECMACGFCKDACCQWGADVDLAERDRILQQAEALRPFVAAPPEEWFTPEVKVDDDYPSGKYVRTQAKDGRCVFRNPSGRGCQLHAWALSRGSDYHDIKPVVCWLFPVIWDRGVLRPSSDVRDDLVCVGPGQTLYRATRHELLQYFGEALVSELDALEAAA